MGRDSTVGLGAVTVTKTLPTWRGRSRFRYEGSIAVGTRLWFGEGLRFSTYVSAEAYSKLLAHFGGREVSIGTSRDAPPEGSVGDWLKRHVTKAAIASYAGPILIHEGYAEAGTEPDEIRFRRAESYPAANLSVKGGQDDVQGGSVMADTRTTIAQLREMVARFVREREWEKFHEPKNLSMAIAVEAAELMDVLRWASTEETRTRASEPSLRAQLEEELADVIIFCLSLANNLRIDVSDTVTTKLRANAVKYPVEKYRGRYTT
jgi:NTP pyrophosphatase (non-canonical NTP hydrolase)